MKTYLFPLVSSRSIGRLQLLFFSFLLASYRATIASAAYNKLMPPLTENFDPEDTNPEANITCLGDSYDLFQIYQQPSQRTYELQLDIEDDFTVPRAKENGKLGNTAVDSMQIQSHSQIGVALMYAGMLSTEILSAEAICLPFFCPIRFRLQILQICGRCVRRSFREVLRKRALPPLFPYIPPQRATLTPSCFARGAKTGGYRHRSVSADGSVQRTVWFSDEMTPCLDWTWNGNFFVAASIRWQRCACDNLTNNLWRFVQGHELELRSDGSLVSQIQESVQGQSQCCLHRGA